MCATSPAAPTDNWLSEQHPLQQQSQLQRQRQRHSMNLDSARWYATFFVHNFYADSETQTYCSNGVRAYVCVCVCVWVCVLCELLPAATATATATCNCSYKILCVIATPTTPTSRQSVAIREERCCRVLMEQQQKQQRQQQHQQQQLQYLQKQFDRQSSEIMSTHA